MTTVTPLSSAIRAPSVLINLTGPYKGAPFGLSVVVPAEAGPFKLAGNTGNGLEVAGGNRRQPEDRGAHHHHRPAAADRRRRAAAPAHESTSTSTGRTSCSTRRTATRCTSAGDPHRSTGRERAASRARLRSAGCQSLPFAPELTASTEGHASKANGASLDVKIETAGLGHANIAKVDLQLPVALPSRLTTLQKACVEAVFNANPAACPEGSVIGKATIHTPILNAPLTGPRTSSPTVVRRSPTSSSCCRAKASP